MTAPIVFLAVAVIFCGLAIDHGLTGVANALFEVAAALRNRR